MKREISENQGYFRVIALLRPIYFVILYKHILPLYCVIHNNFQWIIHKSTKDKLIAKRDRATSIRRLIFIGAIQKIYVLETRLVWLALLLIQDFTFVWLILKIENLSHNYLSFLHPCFRQECGRVTWTDTSKKGITIWHTTATIFLISSLIFSWRIMTLQYCVGFCHTSTRISHWCTFAPSLLNLSPSSYPISPVLVVTEYRIEAPCHTANSHCLSISHGVIYMFQCYYCYQLTDFPFFASIFSIFWGLDEKM